MEKASIVITCYNQGALAEETINSALHQTYSNMEIIVIDDGSTDASTIEVLKQFHDKNLNCLNIIRQNNIGVSGARNTGVKHATGKYLVFLDGDDCIAKDFVKKTVRVMEKTNSKMVYSYTKFFGIYHHIWRLEKPSYEHLLVKNMIPLTCLVRTEDVKKIGGFREEFNQGIEDWDFWIRMLREGDIVSRVNAPLFMYRRQKKSRNTNLKKSNKAMNEMILLLHQCNKEIYQQYPAQDAINTVVSVNQMKRLALSVNYLVSSVKEYSVFSI